MSYRPSRLLRVRQDSSSSLDLPVSGSLVVGSPDPTASALAQNTAAVPGSGLATGVPLIPSSDSPPVATSTSTPSTAASSTASTTSASSGQIPLGTVIGACLAAFVALVLAIVLAVYCSRRQRRTPQKRSPTSRARNLASNASRRRSHLEPWDRLKDEEEDHWEGKSATSASAAKQRPASVSGPFEKLAAMFGRSPSANSSEEKPAGARGAGRESFGTLQPFEKYHPDLAAEMASGLASEAGSQIAKPPPVRSFMGRTEIGPAVSWDGETIAADSFLSGTMSPTFVSKEKLTPAATASDPHRWERAEVLHTDYAGSIASHPSSFADSSSAKLRRAPSNPFFNAQVKQFKRPTPPKPQPNPFADPAPADEVSSPVESPANAIPASNTRALQSLIAALQPADADPRSRVVSMQSSVYSSGSYIANGNDDVDSVTSLPYPSAQFSRS
ncbi:hypothetical protein ID866_4863 [Astraeus odoratus]|nr:hypothetical protein ID866_4863 [Astraeus odoratus]